MTTPALISLPTSPEELIATLEDRLDALGHGSRARLADHLGVKRMAVSQWLARKRDPDCARTLAILAWLQWTEP